VLELYLLLEDTTYSLQEYKTVVKFYLLNKKKEIPGSTNLKHYLNSFLQREGNFLQNSISNGINFDCRRT
jgi:hypothetical protein